MCLFPIYGAWVGCVCLREAQAGKERTACKTARPSTSTDLEDLGDDGGVGGGNNGTTGVDMSEAGLSTGAKAGIGIGAALGAIGALAPGALFWWRRNRGETARATKEQTLGHDKSDLDAAAAVGKRCQDDGERKSEDTVLDSQPELDSTSFKGVEADSKVAVSAVELDPSPRHQAGTREELDGSAAGSELPSGGKRVTAELPG